MITNYTFGKITVNDKTYTSDVIISDSEVIEDNWWRDEGHFLQLVDLEQVFAEDPGIFIMGRGKNGRVEISKKVKEELKQRGIDFRYHKTDKAVKVYNKLDSATGKDLVAGFHLTC